MLRVGDTVIHTNESAKMDIKKKRKGQIIQVYRKYIVVRFTAGYNECFLKWDINKGLENLKKVI